MSGIYAFIIFNKSEKNRGELSTDGSGELDSGIILKELFQFLDVSSFGFFTRSTVREFLMVGSREITNKFLAKGHHHGAVSERDYSFCITTSHGGLVGVLVTKVEYPSRAALGVIRKALQLFEMDDLQGIEKLVSSPHQPELDKIGAIQRDLDVTKTTLLQGLDSLLARGEKLEDLVERSDQLSMTSKLFLREAKKTNRCCAIL
jgi:synaptobrevin family protein YKT6